MKGMVKWFGPADKLQHQQMLPVTGLWRALICSLALILWCQWSRLWHSKLPKTRSFTPGHLHCHYFWWWTRNQKDNKQSLAQLQNKYMIQSLNLYSTSHHRITSKKQQQDKNLHLHLSRNRKEMSVSHQQPDKSTKTAEMQIYDHLSIEDKTETLGWIEDQG